LNITNTAFNFYADSNGKDPDSASPTLRRYHKLLWSKKLPNDQTFVLKEKISGAYLSHKSCLGKFYLGSDAITHSYKYHKRKKHIVQQIPQDVNELYDKGSTIGGYIIFPNNRIDGKHTINQARGISKLIDDRFDLTLECIRRYYQNKPSPLFETLKRYSNFFSLFLNFNGYVKYFLLDDLVDDQQNVLFYLPFTNFNNPPQFRDVRDYLNYKANVTNFIDERNARIMEYANSIKNNVV